MISIYYKGRMRKLKAVLEYQGSQVLRIRVQGSRSTILLENDYPLLKSKQSKRGIKWKIREGSFAATDKDSTQFLIDIFTSLEEQIKRDLK